jgi:WD40 repeat protein
MISTSEDGVCVLWNLKTYIKLRTILASYSFKFGIFHPDSYQILTIGSDRKIRYW